LKTRDSPKKLIRNETNPSLRRRARYIRLQSRTEATRRSQVSRIDVLPSQKSSTAKKTQPRRINYTAKRWIKRRMRMVWSRNQTGRRRIKSRRRRRKKRRRKRRRT
jgi:hypothetical protein